MITTELVKFSELVEGDLYIESPAENWLESEAVGRVVMIRTKAELKSWMEDQQTYRVTITREVNESKK